VNTIDYEDSDTRIVHKTGISNTLDRDYSIINRVRSIDKTNDKFMKRTRSVSRSRVSSRELKETIPIARKDSSNWTERGTQASVGGVLGVVKKKRAKSKIRDGSDGRDDTGGKGFLRGRSSSRSRSDSLGPAKGFRRSVSRGLSKIRGKKKEVKRGRSKDRHDDGSSFNKKSAGGHLPPMAPGSNRPPRPMQPEEETEPEVVDDAIDKLLAENQLLEEIEGQTEIALGQENFKDNDSSPESLSPTGVMQLDEGNTKLHVACLLHHSNDLIMGHLENEPHLARRSNNANEVPLHYAAMDKKGVDKDVLKKLIQSYPEAVKHQNVEHSLPIHLACMAGAPSTYVIKTFLKMYPKAAMMQTDIPLPFEDDMGDINNDEDSDEDSYDDEFVAYTPKQTTAASGIASFFACAAPHQASIEMANERAKRKEEKKKSKQFSHSHEDDGSKTETGFSALHLAVINSTDPSVISLILRLNSRCIHLKTSRGRTALDCAQYIVKQHWLYGSDDEEAIQNTFGTIEVLEAALMED